MTKFYGIYNEFGRIGATGWFDEPPLNSVEIPAGVRESILDNPIFLLDYRAEKHGDKMVLVRRASFPPVRDPLDKILADLGGEGVHSQPQD